MRKTFVLLLVLLVCPILEAFDYQRVATQGMSAAQRESWILKDTEREPRRFDDGQNKYELSINKDGWTVGRDALLAMAETRRMIDRLSATGK